MNRIVCLGNLLAPDDSAGLRVLEILRRRELPAGVDLVDGGLGGLGLLRYVEGAGRVVFVDRVMGFSEREPVVVLDAEEVASRASDRFDHDAGLPWLLRILPGVCEGAVPEVLLVGIEDPSAEGAGEAAAELALRLASGGTAP